jgi:hypothetical protein
MRRPDVFAARFGREFLGFWELYPSRVSMNRPGFREASNRRDSRVVRQTIYGRRDLMNLVSILSTGPLFLFTMLGLGAMWVKRNRRELSLLLAIILSYAVGYALFVGKIRYRMPVEPYIVIIGAYGISSVIRKILPSFLANQKEAGQVVKLSI